MVPQQLGSFPSAASPVDPENDCSKVLSLNFAFVLCVCREKEEEWDLVFLSVRKSELASWDLSPRDGTSRTEIQR